MKGQLGSYRRLLENRGHDLRSDSALLPQLFPSQFRRGLRILVKNGEKFFEKNWIRRHLVDDIDFVEVNSAVEHAESRIFKNSGQDDVFQVVQSMSLVNFGEEGRGANGNDLGEMGGVGEMSSIRCFHCWKFWVVYL